MVNPSIICSTVNRITAEHVCILSFPNSHVHFSLFFALHSSLNAPDMKTENHRRQTGHPVCCSLFIVTKSGDA